MFATSIALGSPPSDLFATCSSLIRRKWIAWAFLHRGLSIHFPGAALGSAAPGRSILASLLMASTIV